MHVACRLDGSGGQVPLDRRQSSETETFTGMLPRVALE